MMIFFGRPLRTSFLLPMLLPLFLVHARGFAQDPARAATVRSTGFRWNACPRQACR